MEKKRVDYLDIYKGFAILLILVHHVFQYFPALSGVVGYVTDFHVACFFLASGWVRYITKDKPTVSYKKFAIKKVRRLLVPYIVFAVFSSILKIGVLAITHSFTFDVVQEETYQILTIGNGPVWFLYRLFLIELIVELIFRFVLNKGRYLTGGIAAIVGLVLVTLLQSSENYFVMEFRSLICGSLELVMGYYCAELFCNRDKIQDHALVIGGGYCIIGTIISFVSGVDGTFKTGSYDNGVAFLLVSVLLPIGYMLLAYVLSQKIGSKNVVRRILNYYGLNSIIVLCVHPTILLCFTYPFGGKLSGLSIGVQCGLAFAVWAIILLICVPCIEIINRWLGFLIGKSPKRQ